MEDKEDKKDENEEKEEEDKTSVYFIIFYVGLPIMPLNYFNRASVYFIISFYNKQFISFILIS